MSIKFARSEPVNPKVDVSVIKYYLTILDKVKTQSATNKDFFIGLLNLNHLVAEVNYKVLIGKLPLENLLPYPELLDKLFNSVFFIENVVKHISIGPSSVTFDHRFRVGGISGLSERLRHSPISRTNHSVNFERFPENIADSKQFFSAFKKDRILKHGSEIKIDYFIETDFSITRAVYDYSAGARQNSKFLNKFHVSVKSQYQLEANMDNCKETMLLLYLCGLFGKLDIRSDYTSRNRNHHQFLLYLLLTSYFTKYRLYVGNIKEYAQVLVKEIAKKNQKPLIITDEVHYEDDAAMRQALSTLRHERAVDAWASAEFVSPSMWQTLGRSKALDFW